MVWFLVSKYQGPNFFGAFKGHGNEHFLGGIEAFLSDKWDAFKKKCSKKPCHFLEENWICFFENMKHKYELRFHVVLFFDWTHVVVCKYADRCETILFLSNPDVSKQIIYVICVVKIRDWQSILR